MNPAISACISNGSSALQEAVVLKRRIAELKAEHDDAKKQLEANAVHVRAHIGACDHAEAKYAEANEVAGSVALHVTMAHW